MMIQKNISAPCSVLDFPTREAFARELTTNHYDIVGLSAIIVNVLKLQEMCRMVRELSPASVILVGGHVAAIPGLEAMIDADHIVRGEGISWMRRYLGEDEHAPVRHPAIVSGLQARIMGMRLPDRKGGTAATIIPSVGCPMGCNFCTTSAFFGGKGKFVNFFETGDELFDVMCGIESELKVHSFFVMDENFLLHRTRAMRLLERMKHAGKSWELSVFASANAIRKYTMQELVALGISWVWMGLESPRSSYNKLQTAEVLRPLRIHLKAAEEGSATGQFMVGLAYVEGRGGDKNLDSAYCWLRMAQQSSSVLQRRKTGHGKWNSMVRRRELPDE